MQSGGMDMTETIFGITLAILYPTFFNKFTNYVYRDDELENLKCYRHSWYFSNSFDYVSSSDKTEQDTCIKRREELENRFDFRKHVTMLVFAILGMIMSGVLFGSAPKLGVGLGGFITLFMALGMYWNRYKEQQKLVILGMTFVFILWLSMRLYTVNTIIDVFNWDFGTRM
jgi:hypothetical protein